MVRDGPGGRPGYRTVLAGFPPSASLRGGRHPVVVGVDGSPASLRALEWGMELASDLEVEVIAVHAGAPPDHRTGVTPAPRPSAAGPGAAGPVVAEWCREWTDALGGAAAYRAIVSAWPAPTALIEVCRDEHAHCLVIGSERGFEHSRHGSLLAALIWRAPCPVLVVPARAGDLSTPG